MAGSAQPHFGNIITTERIEAPDRQDTLPKGIARFTVRGVYITAHAHLSFLQACGPGGSHPHLVHEFISSILEEHQPLSDAITTAKWTAPGICGHIFAMHGRKRVEVPYFDK